MSRRIIAEGAEELRFLARLSQTTGRRNFLKWSGATVAVAAVGCTDTGNGVVNPKTGADGNHLRPAAPGEVVNLGTGDEAVLNYAYALEQLEAAFYTQALGTPAFMGLTADGQEVFRDLYAHEVIHRDFLATAIPALGFNLIPSLEFAFPDGVFSSTEALLGLAQTFEDVGVSAYNGAAQLIENVTILGIAGKIVSVEARHAAAIRLLIRPNSGFFAASVDEFGELAVVNEQGLDVVRVPSMVLPLVDPLIMTELDASGLPEPEYTPTTPQAPIG